MFSQLAINEFTSRPPSRRRLAKREASSQMESQVRHDAIATELRAGNLLKATTLASKLPAEDRLPTDHALAITVATSRMADPEETRRRIAAWLTEHARFYEGHHHPAIVSALDALPNPGAAAELMRLCRVHDWTLSEEELKRGVPPPSQR